MKTNQICWLVLLLFFPIRAVWAQQPIEGTYLTEDKSTHVRIYLEKNKLYGKIVWTQDAVDASGRGLTDTENPDKSLRSRPIVGLVLIKDFILGTNKWKNGTIYDPTTGKTYAGELTLTGNKLVVKGSYLLFSQSETWTRLR